MVSEKKGAFFMSTKVKAFIGLTVTLVVLLVLFASKAGYRATRVTEDSKKSKNCCAIANNEEMKENTTQAEVK
jgi:hypothetical protein